MRQKTMRINGDLVKAVKYNLYYGYELVLEHPTMYSTTISEAFAFNLFGSDYLRTVVDNYRTIDSPYYGMRQVWNETPLPN